MQALSEEKTVSKTTAPKPAAASKGAKKTDAGADVAMLEAPAPANRFADRFAPPKPPARGANQADETPRVAAKGDPKLANAWKSKSGAELSDAEVLAMPDSEYMNAKQIEFFRAKLTELKDGVLSNAGETTEHLR